MGDFLSLQMPGVHGLVQGIFDITEQILKTQREFARKMFEQMQGMV